MDGVIAARRANVPAAVTLHNVIMPEVSGGLAARTLAWMEPYVVRASVKTFVPSAEMGLYLRARAHAPDGRIEVLHAGAGEPPVPRRSREAVRAELGITTADPLVVSVARLQPQKALDVMLEAIAMLPANVTLALVGDGRLRADLQTAARELGIADRVRFLGFRHDVADYIAAGDVFCLSSLWEAVPLAAQEAVLLGVPIVSTDVGGLSELIVDGVSGRLVPKNDSRSLAKALEETLSEHDQRRRFADEARRHYDEHFSRAAVLGRLERLYLDAARSS
jgi:glycosyltransferase involved in cell wall biosynthesis